jgi:hypothetical protein
VVNVGEGWAELGLIIDYCRVAKWVNILLEIFWKNIYVEISLAGNILAHFALYSLFFFFHYVIFSQKMRSYREALLKGKAQYSWPPCTNYFGLAHFDIENIIYLYIKQAYIWDDISLKISNVKLNIIDVCNLINASIQLSN